jgi:hypothetical protein
MLISAGDVIVGLALVRLLMKSYNGGMGSNGLTLHVMMYSEIFGHGTQF